MRSSRRTRFAFTVTSAGTPEPHMIHVLVYAVDGKPDQHSFEWLERAGYTVIDWQRARRSTNRNRPRWSVNQSGLEMACRWLDIQWPVKIRRTSHRKRGGAHYIRVTPTGRWPTHCITADKNASPAKAARLLMHELAHAMQSEREIRAAINEDGPANAALWTQRDMLAVWGTCHLRSREIAYDQRPVEVEARQIEKHWANFPLTNPEQ